MQACIYQRFLKGVTNNEAACNVPYLTENADAATTSRAFICSPTESAKAIAGASYSDRNQPCSNCTWPCSSGSWACSNGAWPGSLSCSKLP